MAYCGSVRLLELGFAAGQATLVGRRAGLKIAADDDLDGWVAQVDQLVEQGVEMILDTSIGAAPTAGPAPGELCCLTGHPPRPYAARVGGQPVLRPVWGHG